MNHIVKRKGHTEPYEQRKLYASVYAACLSVRVHAGEAELIASKVCEDVEQWLAKKTEVTAHDIRLQAARYFTDYHPEAGWMYSHHREHFA